MSILRKGLMLKGKGEKLPYFMSAFVALFPSLSHHRAHSSSSGPPRVSSTQHFLPGTCLSAQTSDSLKSISMMLWGCLSHVFIHEFTGQLPTGSCFSLPFCFPAPSLYLPLLPAHLCSAVFTAFCPSCMDVTILLGRLPGLPSHCAQVFPAKNHTHSLSKCQLCPG